MNRKANNIFLLLLLFHGMSLWSQDENLSKALKPVEVTSLLKTSIQLSKLPREVTIISSSQLQKKSGIEVAQLLGQQAGIIVAGANSNYSESKSIFFRGAAGKYTLFMIDGIPLLDPSGVIPFDIRTISTSQLQEIEMATGGNAILYGQSAVSGMINFITKKESDKPLNVDGGLSYGSYRTAKYDVALHGKTGIFSYRLSYNGIQAEGISSALDKIRPLSALEKDPFNQNSFYANFSIQPTKKITINPFFRYADITYDYDGESFKDSSNLQTGHINWQAGLKTIFWIKNHPLSIIYSANKFDWLFNVGEKWNEGLSHFLDIYLNYNLPQFAKLVFGIQAQQYNLVIPTKGEPSNYNINPYASAYLSFFDQLFVEVGFRLISDQQYAVDFAYNLALAYQPLPFLRLGFSQARSYLTPTINQLYGQWGSNPDLLPETAYTWDANISFLVAKEKLVFKVNGFLRDVDNVIVYTTKNENRDKLHEYGTVLKAEFKPSKQILLSAWYTFMEGATMNYFPSGESINYTWIRRPKHSAGFDAQLTLFKSFDVALNLYYNDERKDFDYSIYPYTAVALDPYVLVNLNLSYRLWNNRLRLFIDIRNLTDTKFEEAYGYATMGVNIMGGVSFNF